MDCIKKIICEKDEIPTSVIPVTSVVPYNLETYIRKVSFFDRELNNLKRAYGFFLDPSDGISFFKESLAESECESGNWKDEQCSIDECKQKIYENEETLVSLKNSGKFDIEGSNYQLQEHPNFFCSSHIESNRKEQQLDCEHQSSLRKHQSHDLSCKQQTLAHLPKRDEEKPFSCPTCIKVFPSHQHLVQHLEHHHEEKVNMTRSFLEHNFKCNTCQKCFSKKESMIKHARIHTRDLMKCSLCDFTCNRKVTLKMHLVSHEGNRKYKCNHCDFSFKQIGHLKRHVARFKH